MKKTIKEILKIKRAELSEHIEKYGLMNFDDFQDEINSFITLEVVKPYKKKVLGNYPIGYSITFSPSEYPLEVYEDYYKAVMYTEHILDSGVEIDLSEIIDEDLYDYMEDEMYNTESYKSLVDFIYDYQQRVEELVDEFADELGTETFITKYKELIPKCKNPEARDLIFWDIKEYVRDYILCSLYKMNFYTRVKK